MPVPVQSPGAAEGPTDTRQRHSAVKRRGDATGTRTNTGFGHRGRAAVLCRVVVLRWLEVWMRTGVAMGVRVGVRMRMREPLLQLLGSQAMEGLLGWGVVLVLVLLRRVVLVLVLLRRVVLVLVRVLVRVLVLLRRVEAHAMMGRHAGGGRHRRRGSEGVPAGDGGGGRCTHGQRGLGRGHRHATRVWVWGGQPHLVVQRRRRVAVDTPLPHGVGGDGGAGGSTWWGIGGWWGHGLAWFGGRRHVGVGVHVLRRWGEAGLALQCPQGRLLSRYDVLVHHV